MANTNLGLLTTGLIKQTISGAAATLSTAVPGVDYQPPPTLIYNLTTSPEAPAVGTAGAEIRVFIGTDGAGTNTGLANAMAFNAPTGTPIAGQKLTFRIKDNATAHALDFTTSTAYRPVGVVLPTTTVISKLLYVGCIYNAINGTWDCVSVSQE